MAHDLSWLEWNHLLAHAVGSLTMALQLSWSCWVKWRATAKSPEHGTQSTWLVALHRSPAPAINCVLASWSSENGLLPRRSVSVWPPMYTTFLVLLLAPVNCAAFPLSGSASVKTHAVPTPSPHLGTPQSAKLSQAQLPRGE